MQGNCFVNLNMKLFFLCLMALGYVIAGIFHFTHPSVYKKIMPLWLPYHHALIYISGVCEIVFGLMLIPEYTRPIGAWLIIAMLVAIFPANIQMMINFWNRNNPYLWIAIARLPLQIVLIWWALAYTK